MPTLKQQIGFGSALIFGLFFAVVGIFLLAGFPLNRIITKQVLDQTHLGYTRDANGTEVPNSMTASWLKPSYDMRLHIWMFNVTNVADVLSRHSKPNLQQIGPFVFDEHQQKTYHRFEENDTRVFYKNNHLYFFNRSSSCETCDLDLKFTIPNVVFQKLVDAAEETVWGIRLRLAIEAVLKVAKEGPFVTVTARDALFDGYHDPLIDLVCENRILKFLCETGFIQQRIGFFYGQNATADGIYEVDTGMPNPLRISKVYSWNNMTIIPESAWDSVYARMINGTDGQLFSPMLIKNQRLHIFVPQICRSIQLAYTRDVSFRGVPSWRYMPPIDLYDPTRPENRDFCNKNGTPRYFQNETVQIDTCLPAGFIDVSRCQPGNPRVYLSQPHFYNSPKEVWNAVTGLDVPSANNDATFVDLEPTTGVPVRAHRIMQINVGMVKGDLSLTANTSNVIVPVLWINETATFDEGTAQQLRDIESYRHKAFIGGVSSLTIGLLSWLTVFAVMILYARQSSDEEFSRLILDEDDGDDVAQQDVVVD